MNQHRIIVAGRNANGEPDLVRVVVECTQEHIDNGDHYDMAVEIAEERGYEGPFICFDQTEQNRIVTIAREITTGV